MNDLLVDQNYSIFAGGQICYHLPGAPSISIKLVERVFNRSIELSNRDRKQLTIYDPCCGSAYHFIALGYLFWHKIKHIICSDSDSKILEIAQKNLSLLTLSGLKRRINELEEMIEKFNKKSHVLNYQNAHKLKNILEENIQGHEIKTTIFKHNIVQEKVNCDNIKCNVDLVFADIPYGNLSQWEDNENLDENTCAANLLSNIEEIMCKDALITMVATKKIRINHPSYTVIQKMKIGKRRILFIRKI